MQAKWLVLRSAALLLMAANALAQDIVVDPDGPQPSKSATAGAIVDSATPSAAADPLDWPNWRGPQHNNSSPETGLPAKWNPKGGNGSNLLWKSAELAGRSTPIILRGKLYTQVRDKPRSETEGEKVVCADAATGKVIWEHPFNVYLTDQPDTRVGWSSVVGDPATGRVYCQGSCGYFCCLEGDTGKLVWERSLHEELGFITTYGGRVNFPLVYGDTVITSAVVVGWGDTPPWSLMAKPAHRFMAMDKATGELRWLSGTGLIPTDTTYSTPAMATLGGQRLMVFGSGDGNLWGMNAGTGKMIWNYPFSRRGINTSPVVGPDGTVYGGHSEENTVGPTMGGVVALDGAATGDQSGKEKWREFEVLVGKCSPVVVEDRLYFFTETGKMMVYDTKTGNLLERKALGRSGRSTPLYADGKIYVPTSEGMMYILEPNAAGLKTLHKVRLGEEEFNASPIVSHGRVYLTGSKYVYCLAQPQATSIATAVPSAPTTPSDDKPATLQVSPWDALLKPGDSQQLTARLFNAKGEFLREVAGSDLQYAVTIGPGKVTPDGRYQAPAGNNHAGALVTTKFGELTATSRMRIIPPLPWKFDFTGAEDVPITWVGGRVRYVVRGEGADKYIAKPSDLPTKPGAPSTKLGTRSQMFMGPADLSNYTLQADLNLQTGLAGESDDVGPKPEAPPVIEGVNTEKFPDVGLINGRYVLAIWGTAGELRLFSWATHDFRTQKEIPFKPEANAWYTMKIKVVPEADHAHVYGKIWKRGESEPSEWTIEIEDPRPNMQGAPGMYGNSSDAEFYVDNILVTPNE